MHGIAARCREEDMTAKRKLKRHVRERQVRTGERYTTAHRRILAERSGAPPEETAAEAAAEEAVSKTAAEETVSKTAAEETASETVPVDVAPVGSAAGTAPAEDAAAPVAAASVEGASVEAASGTVQVIELLDVSDDASRLGLRCRVMMFPALAERTEPASVLASLRDVLVGTAGDPSTALLGSVVLNGQRPTRPRPAPALPDLEALRRFFRRARAGLGGTIEDGSMLAFHVAGRDGIVPVLCTLSHRDRSVTLTVITGAEPDMWEHFVALHVPPVRVVDLQEPVLFLIHDGRRYPVTVARLVIGSGRGISGLAIGDAALAPRHAAVIHRHGSYYLKDLESIDGIHYKGMRIDNKRIDEGDVFHIGAHEIRFTYRADG
jgi:hypothetical protein